MANDIARLGFSADTSALEKAKADLNAIVPPAEKVERAAKKAGDAITGMAAKGDTLNRVEAAARGAASGLDRVDQAASGAKSKLDRLGKAANDNLNAVQATPANIAAQFQDIGVTAAAGMNPLLIALQQGTQLSVAFAGGFKGIGAALAQVFSPVSLLTVGMVALTAAAIQWGIEALNSASKTSQLVEQLDKVKFSSYALNTAQGILGGVMDITTGKINTQSSALLGLARAQLALAKIQSQARAADARAQLTEMSKPTRSFDFNMMGGITLNERGSVVGQIESQLRNGVIDYENAIKQLERFRDIKRLSDVEFANAAAAFANLGVEEANQKVFSDAQRLLDGDKSGTGYLLKPDKPKKPRKAAEGKSEAEKEADRYKELISDLNIYNNELERNYGAIGLVGQAQIEYNKQTEIYKRAADQNIDLTKEDRQATIDLAIAKAAEMEQRNRNLESYYNEKNAILANLSALTAEYDTLGMSAKAVAMLAYEKKLLNDERFKGIVYSDEEKQRLLELKERELDLTEAVRKRREQMEFDRDASRGFFRDLVQGARDGKSAWESFADAFNNVMDKIIDKLLNEVLDAIFQVNNAASSGGLLGFLGKAVGMVGSALGGGGGASVWNSMDSSIQGLPTGSQISDSIGSMTFHAKGDAFTNGIASGPTAFRYGNNMGVMGEAGDEAVMPLSRGPDGSLGVQMYGDVATPSTPQQGPVTFDMRGAIVTEDLLQQMNSIAADRADVAVIRERTRNERVGQRKFSKK